MTLPIPQNILTRRLNIRPHTPEDKDAFVSFMTDDVATRYLNFEDVQKAPKGAAELLDYVIASYETDAPVMALAVTERSNEAYLGACGLTPVASEENTYECYFWLLPNYWGWGYATEALRAMLYFAFVEQDVQTVVTFVHEGNESAIKVAENAGMSDEGPAKLASAPNTHRYSISAEEFSALFLQEGNE